MIVYHGLITTRVSEYGYDLETKGQSQIFLKTVKLPIIQTPLWCIDRMCSYLALPLRMICLIKQRFQIADMTLWSKVNVTHA